MKPLIVLLVTFTIALFVLKLKQGTYDFAFSGRIAMSTMLLFTALGHFMFTDGMTMMIPDFIPFKKETVYLTAILEILGAFALHIMQLRTITAWLLILFFLLLLPANIKASVEHINYQKGTYNGNGLLYLGFRIPLQMLFIAWVHFSAIRQY
ncbi:MAG: hypothetical protein COA50_14840 [Flavobacteriaceae bacterium]|nr:MAG: hypothetical protein COA50_14840 [Flavobacteriaceae bacterium]